MQTTLARVFLMTKSRSALARAGRTTGAHHTPDFRGRFSFRNGNCPARRPSALSLQRASVRILLFWLWGLTPLAALSAQAHSLASTQKASLASGPDEYAIDTWQMRDGLPGQSVSSFSETPDGYLWIGTSGGLVRFDGSRFRLGLSRSDLASYLGITLETVSRCLTELRRRRLIEVRAKELRLLQPAELELVLG